MTNLPRDRMIVAGKLGMLLVTTILLMATSRPPDCDQRAAPMVFHAAGTCGPGGLIVVETDGRSSTTTLANAAALGLPPRDPSQGNSGYYVGKACPFTVEKGEWRFDWTCAVSPDGGSGGVGADGGADLTAAVDGSDGPSGRAAGGDGDGTPVDAALVAAADGGAGGVGGTGGGLTMSCLRSCIAHLGQNGELLFTCSDARGELLCESRLTKVVLP